MKNFAELSARQQVLVLVTAMVAIAMVVAALVFLPGVFRDRNAKKVTEAVDTLALLQVNAFNEAVDRLRGELSAQLRSTGVVQLFLQNDSERLNAVAEQVKASPAGSNMVQLRFVPSGIDYATQGLKFSQVERLQAAEKGGEVYPEAFDEGGKKRFDAILLVKDDAGVLRGFMVGVFDAEWLSASLAGIKPDVAETVLQQKFDNGRPFAVYRTGKSNSMERASKPKDTAVPHWKLVVVPSPALLAETETAPAILYGIQAAVLVLACLALFVVVRRTGSSATVAVQQDHVTPIQIKGARRIDKNEVATESPTEQAEAFDEALADPLFQSADVFDLDFDDDALDINPVPAPPPSAAEPTRIITPRESFSAPATIFRDYDIRGHADRDLSDELARRIGQAFGTECRAKGHETVVLGGDGRLSTPRLKLAVQQGLQASGCHVIDIGTVPTPLMNFAVNTVMGARCGLMVTASHNPGSDNGFKMVMDGYSLASEQIQRLRERVETGDFVEGAGECSEREVVADYIENIVSDIVLAGSYKVVVDCGNGVAGLVAPRLLEELGCDVVPLYCDVDGHFPNHAPDPSVMDNLADLVARVVSEGADLGVALDGDGDRLTVVTASGRIILPDCLLILFAKDVVSRNPGTDIIFDVKSTRRLNALISSCGGRPVMWKSGHSHIKNKMVETGAMLGGELSGHIFFKERWFGFDDGLYSAARLLEIMSIRDQDLDGIIDTLPDAASTPEIRVPMAEDRKFQLVRQLADRGEWGNGKLVTIDGVRVEFAKGWGLVRASNTAAEITLRFEADDEETLATVQQVFKQQLLAVEPSLNLPF